MNSRRVASLDLIVLSLRIGLGAVFIVHGWPKMSDPATNAALWRDLHLPLPTVLAPVQGVVEFFGGIFLLGGLLTRLVNVLLAVDVLGAILVVDIHTGAIIGLEWLALWVSIALLVGGAGSLSLDARLPYQGRRA